MRVCTSRSRTALFALLAATASLGAGCDRVYLLDAALPSDAGPPRPRDGGPRPDALVLGQPIDVLVVDDRGAGVADARVVVHGTHAVEATTRGDGTVRIALPLAWRPAPLAIEASAPGHRPTTRVGVVVDSLEGDRVVVPVSRAPEDAMRARVSGRILGRTDPSHLVAVQPDVAGATTAVLGPGSDEYTIEVPIGSREVWLYVVEYEVSVEPELHLEPWFACARASIGAVDGPREGVDVTLASPPVRQVAEGLLSRPPEGHPMRNVVPSVLVTSLDTRLEALYGTGERIEATPAGGWAYRASWQVPHEASEPYTLYRLGSGTRYSTMRVSGTPRAGPSGGGTWADGPSVEEPSFGITARVGSTIRVAPLGPDLELRASIGPDRGTSRWLVIAGRATRFELPPVPAGLDASRWDTVPIARLFACEPHPSYPLLCTRSAGDGIAELDLSAAP